MLRLSTTGAAALTAAMIMMTAGNVAVAEEMKYPNWKGQWITINYRLGGQVIKYDPDKPWGLSKITQTR